MTVAVRRAAGAAERGAALDLRRAVFCDEQGVPLEEELDGRDDEAVHLVALDGAAVVGTCRLLPDAPDTMRLGRMAVAAPARGQGIAGRLLEAAHAEARRAGCTRMTLSAQLPARTVYARAGYAEHGGVFLDAGIEHVEMERALV